MATADRELHGLGASRAASCRRGWRVLQAQFLVRRMDGARLFEQGARPQAMAEVELGFCQRDLRVREGRAVLRGATRCGIDQRFPRTSTS